MMRILCLIAAVCLGATEARAGKVHVLLWFDSEDYLLEPDDGATLRLAGWLSEQGVRASTSGASRSSTAAR